MIVIDNVNFKNDEVKHYQGASMIDKLDIDSPDLLYNATVRLVDSQNDIIASHTGHNLILNNGKLELLKRLCGDSANTLGWCAVGTGGVGVDPFTPIDPIATQISLNAEVLRLPFASKIYGASGAVTVTLSTVFLSTQVNNIVSEAGLCMASNGGIVFARYTYPSMYLKADRGYSLEVDWTIQF